MSVGITALVVTGVSAAASAHQGRKAKKAQKRANDAQRKINRLKNFQAKRAFLRQVRQAQAANLQEGIAAGVGLESSRVQGTQSSQEAQTRSSVTEFGVMDKLGTAQTSALNKAAQYQYNAGLFSTVSNFALQFAKFSAKPSTDPRRLPGDDSGLVTEKPSIFNAAAASDNG